MPVGAVIDDDTTMAAYDTDGLSAYRNQPLVVVLPETTQQVAAVMKWCLDNDVKIVPRGAGTSLSGGAIPSCRWRPSRLGKIQSDLRY